MDIRLKDGDIDTTGATFSLTSGNLESVGQHVAIRLQTFQGECFLDVAVGIPYFNDIFVKNPIPEAISGILREAISTTPGIVGIDQFDLDLDSATRKLSVAFRAEVTDSEEPLVFDRELIIV